jgi:uncharacterized membrane protein
MSDKRSKTVSQSPKGKESNPKKDNSNVASKIKDSQNKKKKQNKDKKDKNEDQSFFGQFKTTLIDDFKGTGIVLLIYAVICLAVKSIHPLSIVVSGF